MRSHSRSAAHLKGPRVRPPQGLTSHTLVLAGLSAAALVACAKVGEDVFSKETAPFDEPIRAWFLTRRSPAGERFFLLVTNAGGPSVLIPFSVAMGAWLRTRLNLKIAGTVLLAPAAALTLFLLVKAVYRRRRPAGGAKLRSQTYSFPSGHSAASAAVFGTLAYVLWREELLGDTAASALAIAPPLLIGTSRVYLDVHWATDVLGGWAVGSVVTVLSALVYERVRTLTRDKNG